MWSCTSPRLCSSPLSHCLNRLPEHPRKIPANDFCTHLFYCWFWLRNVYCHLSCFTFFMAWIFHTCSYFPSQEQKRRAWEG